MKEYYKIGEISKIYDIGRDSLMYYEEIGILKPFRDKNGYRMYKLTDIWRLNLIKELRSLNVPMKRIKEYLDDRDLESTNKILKEEIDLIDLKIKELLNHKNNIEERLKSIDEAINGANLNEINVQYISKRKAIILNANITRNEDVDFLIQKLQKEYEERFNILGKNNIGAIFSLEKLNANIYNEFKSVFCLLENEEKIYNIVFEEGYYVTLVYKGGYNNNSTYIKNMFDFIKNKNYEIVGEPLEIYKIDIHETGKEEEFITEIQIPIKL